MYKKVLSLILGATFLAGSVFMPVYAAGNTLSVGEFVYFGKFYEESVPYEVVAIEDINNDGVNEYMLLARYLIAYRAYDLESTDWETSSLREWLNGENAIVDFTGKKPSAENGLSKPYDTDTGFIYNMAAAEKVLLVPVEHDGASDKVFILDKSGCGTVNTAQKIPGQWTNATGTGGFTSAVQRAWTRTPASTTNMYRTTNSGGNLDFESQPYTNENTGVRPAMYISSDFTITGGSGTIGAPYTIAGEVTGGGDEGSGEIPDEYGTNVSLLISMGILSGDGRPANDPEYLAEPITRMTAAVLALKLYGKLEDAKAYKGTSNFSDANEASDFYRSILAYLHDHEELGMRGIGENLFAPNKVIRARDFYRIMLKILGYSETDYTEETMESFIHSLGMGDVYYVESFDRRDLGCALFEMLMQKPKGSSNTYARELFTDGIISETALGNFNNKAGNLSVITDGSYTAQGMNTDTHFSFSKTNLGDVIAKEQFGYNTPFQMAGLYYGTLPEGETGSKRAEFAERLEEIGCEMMRFPGGTQAHQYLIGSKAMTEELFYDVRSANTGMNQNYDPTNPLTCYYTEFFDWLEFCQEHEIIPCFQLNTFFYYDTTEGKTMALTKNAYVSDTEGNIKMAGYYDGDRTAKAAEELGFVIDEMIERGLYMKYWEVGNEDYVRLNYQGTGINSAGNETTENYAKIAAAYTEVIKQKIPDAVIILTDGMGSDIETALETTGLYDKMGPFAKHYPFKKIITPQNNKNLTEFLYINEQDFAREKSDSAHPVVITETSMWHYDNWDPRTVQSSFANALSTAHNYLEMVFESGWELLMIHDLESPYYGAMPYNVVLDPGDRKAKIWTGNNTSPELVTDISDIPEENKFFNEYFYYPSAHSFGMIAEHVGGARLISGSSNVGRMISGYASLCGDKILMTVINRTGTKQEITARFDGYKISSQYAKGKFMQSDWLGAIADCEYTYEPASVNVSSQKNCQGTTIAFSVQGYSVTNIELQLDN